MHKQLGLDVLKYECCVLEALNTGDRNDLQIRKELGLHSPDVIEALERSANSIIRNRESKIAKYRVKYDELLQDHDPQSNLLSNDALEFLYQEFLEENLHCILKDIEKFYDNNVQHLLSNGLAHFTKSAQKMAKHNLYTHTTGYIAYGRLTDCKIKELNQVISLLSSGLLKDFRNKSIEYLISQKYDYFADRIQCCLEIGNKIRSL